MSASEDLVRSAIVGSPFGMLVGVEPETIEPDRVRLRLPFRPEVTTVGEVVHGGAIASLVDVAATAAVWSGADLATSQRGTTIGFTLSFLAAGRGQDLLATATVIQRGRTICVCEVDVRGADGNPVARALVTYKVG
ncbi:MAG TPA: PaaI family thioesterase [Candidatus Nitrosopolaris sp.]|nr:PaaI family thioesterase [Candidatus Nitrosopolaris sp.]